MKLKLFFLAIFLLSLSFLGCVKSLFREATHQQILFDLQKEFAKKKRELDSLQLVGRKVAIPVFPKPSKKGFQWGSGPFGEGGPYINGSFWVIFFDPRKGVTAYVNSNGDGGRLQFVSETKRIGHYHLFFEKESDDHACFSSMEMKIVKEMEIFIRNINF